jgi:hypothetical protein
MGIRDSAPVVFLRTVMHGFVYSWFCEIFAHHSNVLIERLKLVAIAFGCVWLVTDNIDILDARASFFRRILKMFYVKITINVAF